MNQAASWTGRKVLVTGASGFLGAALCRRLATAGAQVHGVSRRGAARGTASVAWHQADLTDAEAARRLVADVRPHVLFHLAGVASGARDLSLVLPSLHGDLLTTVHLLAAATELECGRVIVTGSLEEPAPGMANVTPSSPYAAAKWAGTAYARMFHALYGTPVVIARPFMTYGPGQRPEKIIPYAARCFLTGETPKLGNGQRLVDWVYVDDVIEGLLALALAPGLEGSTIDFGSGALVPIREVVERIAALSGSTIRPAYDAATSRVGEVVVAADAERTAAVLGWRATTTLEAGLQQTVAWYGQGLQARLKACR